MSFKIATRKKTIIEWDISSLHSRSTVGLAKPFNALAGLFKLVGFGAFLMSFAAFRVLLPFAIGLDFAVTVPCDASKVPGCVALSPAAADALLVILFEVPSDFMTHDWTCWVAT